MTIATLSAARRLLGLLLPLLLVLGPRTTSAEEGVTADAIVLGRTAGLTGQIAGSMKEQTTAIEAYFNWVNRNGGIYGRRIVLKNRDDGFLPKRAGENAKLLISEDHVFALFMPRGTPHTEAVLAQAMPAGVPVIAPSTGARIFHEPVNRLVFNVRAPYQDEVAASVRHLATVAIRRIALLHVNDSFGMDGKQGFERAMRELGLTPVRIMSFDRVRNDSVNAVPDMLKADPAAVIVVGSTTAVTNFVKEMKARGSAAQFVTLSNNSSNSFIQDLGPAGRGVMMTQVTPAASSTTTPLGREFQRIAGAEGAVPSYVAMEGFVAAKVTVEALRRAGKDLSRERFIAALESMRNYDLGGMSVGFSPNNHTGSTFVEMSMVSSSGTFVR